MNNPPYVTVKYATWHFMKIPPFIFLLTVLSKNYTSIMRMLKLQTPEDIDMQDVLHF